MSINQWVVGNISGHINTRMKLGYILQSQNYQLSNLTNHLIEQYFDNKKTWEMSLEGCILTATPTNKKRKDVVKIPIFTISSAANHGYLSDKLETNLLKIRYDKIQDVEYLYKMHVITDKIATTQWNQYIHLGKKLNLLKETQHGISDDCTEFTFFYDNDWRIGTAHQIISKGLKSCRPTTHQDYIDWADHSLDESNRRKEIRLDMGLVPEINRASRAYRKYHRCAKISAMYKLALTGAIKNNLGLANSGHNFKVFSVNHVVVHQMHELIWVWSPENVNHSKPFGATHYKCIIEGMLISDKAVPVLPEMISECS